MEHHERIGRGQAKYDAVKAQGIISMVERKEQDASQPYEGVGNVQHGQEAETLMGYEEALVRSINDAQTGGKDGHLIDEHGIIELAVCHIQLVVDIPQSDALCQQEDDAGQQHMQQHVDVENAVDIAVLLSHLHVEETRGGGGERTADEGEHGQDTAHHGKQTVVRSTQYLQHQPRGVQPYHHHGEQAHIHIGGVLDDAPVGRTCLAVCHLLRNV